MMKKSLFVQTVPNSFFSCWFQVYLKIGKILSIHFTTTNLMMGKERRKMTGYSLFFSFPQKYKYIANIFLKGQIIHEQG